MLARMLAERNDGEPVSTALQSYQAARLLYVRALVNHSRHLSAEYVHHASSRSNRD